MTSESNVFKVYLDGDNSYLSDYIFGNLSQFIKIEQLEGYNLNVTYSYQV